jgi:hypothetical protein
MFASPREDVEFDTTGIADAGRKVKTRSDKPKRANADVKECISIA